jgi:ribosomal protein S18 acetylase RimI-like enzyme
MSDVCEIREARATDLRDILRLLRVQLDEQSVAISDDALQSATTGIIANPERGRILVAGVADEIVAVAVISFLWTLEHGGEAAWLDELYVEPSHRRRGLGKRLIDAAMDVARARGCLALDLEVEPDHDAAVRLYEAVGFRRHRRVRWYYPLV